MNRSISKKDVCYIARYKDRRHDKIFQSKQKAMQTNPYYVYLAPMPDQYWSKNSPYPDEECWALYRGEPSRATFVLRNGKGFYKLPGHRRTVPESEINGWLSLDWFITVSMNAYSVAEYAKKDNLNKMA